MRFVENEIESESTCENEDIEDAGRVQRLDDDLDCGLGGEGQGAGGETGEGEDGQARSDGTAGKGVLANMMPLTLVSLLVKLDISAMEKKMHWRSKLRKVRYFQTPPNANLFGES